MAHFDCYKCTAFSTDRQCCSVGKTNPRSKKDVHAVVETLGAASLCFRNRHREALLYRMFHPKEPLNRTLKVRLGTPVKLEIEILRENA